MTGICPSWWVTRSVDTGKSLLSRFTWTFSSSVTTLFPLCFLLSRNTCHHPFYLSDDFVPARLPLPVLRVLGFPVPDIGHQLLSHRLGCFAQSSLAILPQRLGCSLRWGKGGCHSQPRRGPTPWARVRVPFLFPATRCHAPSPRLAPRAPSPPSAPSSEAPKPPADALVKVPGPPQPAGHGARRQGPLPRQRAPAARGRGRLSFSLGLRCPLLVGSAAAEFGAGRYPRVSAAPGQRRPLQGRRLLVAEALPLQAKPAQGGERRAVCERHVRIPCFWPPGAGARRASEPASERRRRAGGGRAGDREADRRGSRDDAAVRAAGLQCPLSRESPHARARPHEHTMGSENTRESP